jgi:peptidoglycan LD-endopeptidase LytH
MQQQPVIQVLRRYAQNFHAVVPFKPGKDTLVKLDFTEGNKELTADIISDTTAFSSYINNVIHTTGARYGIGGYNEHRSVYARSKHFDDKGEPRRLHLGVDIWGPAGTAIYAFMGGMVHSMAFNDNYGDYGATMILLHQLDGIPFYTLYGHISLADIKRFSDGQYVIRGQEIAHFGEPAENGQWPPHLHLQIIIELGVKRGDYPGVCKFSEREIYLKNCPDPDLILQMNRYVDREAPERES